MASLVAHLTDRVFPPVQIRQWVLTLPFDLRYRMANDTALTSRVLALFLDELFCWITEQCGTPSTWPHGGWLPPDARLYSGRKPLD